MTAPPPAGPSGQEIIASMNVAKRESNARSNRVDARERSGVTATSADYWTSAGQDFVAGRTTGSASAAGLSAMKKSQSKSAVTSASGTAR